MSIPQILDKRYLDFLKSLLYTVKEHDKFVCGLTYAQIIEETLGRNRI